MLFELAREANFEQKRVCYLLWFYVVNSAL